MRVEKKKETNLESLLVLVVLQALVSKDEVALLPVLTSALGTTLLLQVAVFQKREFLFKMTLDCI
jgi:hypothetical protein